MEIITKTINMPYPHILDEGHSLCEWNKFMNDYLHPLENALNQFVMKYHKYFSDKYGNVDRPSTFDMPRITPNKILYNFDYHEMKDITSAKWGDKIVGTHYNKGKIVGRLVVKVKQVK